MRNNRPSDTAEAMAAARAFGSHIYRREGILDDPFAPRFLSGRLSALYRAVRGVPVQRVELGLAALYDRMLPGSVGWVLTRHRYIDDVVRGAARDGVEQVVIVGAGSDSRALRCRELARVRVFEIDHPDTQARKVEIVRDILGAMPPQVTYLPLDATRGDLRELPRYGYDRAAAALYVLEGFLWYMPPAIAREVLAAIAETAAPGSAVAFDYILPEVVDGTSQLEGADRHRRYCAKRGEPILWGIDPHELGGYLSALGLELVDDIGEDELRSRYTAGSRRPIKIYPFLRVARARVTGRTR
jgi:methyltransferase (TIGR00027 family)